MATCRAPFYIVTTELLPPAHPLFAGLLRALPAGLIALAFTRGSPRGAWWGRGAVLGTLNIGLLSRCSSSRPNAFPEAWPPR